MKPRLMALLAFAVFALCGCVTDQPRPSGSLRDGTYYQEIGGPLPSQLPPANCPVQ